MVTLCCSWCHASKWTCSIFSFFLSCIEMVTPHIQCGHVVLILTEPTSNAHCIRKTVKSNWDFQRSHTILQLPSVFIYTTASVPWQCWFTSHYSTYAFQAITMWSYIITKWIIYSTFMVHSITRLSSSDIVSNFLDCVVCHGASVIIGRANVSQIDANIVTLMTVMVTPCCSWCQCI